MDAPAQNQGHPISQQTQPAPVSPQAPKRKWSFIQIVGTVAAIVALVLAFCPWATLNTTLVQTVNTANSMGFSFLGLLNGSNNSASLSLADSYTPLQFDTLAETLHSYQSNATVLSALAGTKLDALESYSDNGGQGISGEGSSVAFKQNAAFAQVDNNSNSLLGALTGGTSQQSIRNVQAELQTFENTVRITFIAWVISVALLIAGLALFIFSTKANSKIFTLVGTALLALTALGWALGAPLAAPTLLNTGGVLFAYFCVAACVVVVFSLALNNQAEMRLLAEAEGLNVKDWKKNKHTQKAQAKQARKTAKASRKQQSYNPPAPEAPNQESPEQPQ